MQRIDNSGAVASLPAPLAAGTPGYFGRGNPSTGLLATPLSADWANMVQEEIMSVLAEAAITPDKEIYTQLRDALRVLYRGQRSGSQVLITGNTALTAEAHGGGLVIGNSGSGITATLMAASTMLAGRRVALFNVNAGAMTVQRAGTDAFKVNSGTVTSLVLGSGDSLVLESDGASVWYAVAGSVQLRYAAAVATANTPDALVRRDDAGNFSAGTITAALNGNAATAAALQTGRTISLTGDAAGTSAAFDGTGNASIPVSLVAASTTTAGKIEIATAAEVIAGADSSRAVTPSGLAAAVLGLAQVWTDVGASRVAGTNYTNTTGRPIQVAIVVGTGPTNQAFNFFINDVQVGRYQINMAVYFTHYAVVPPGATYRIQSGSNIAGWFELR